MGRTDGVVAKKLFTLKKEKSGLFSVYSIYALTYGGGGAFVCSMPVCVCVRLVFDKPTSIPLGAALSRAQRAESIRLYQYLFFSFSQSLTMTWYVCLTPVLHNVTHYVSGIFSSCRRI